MPTNWTATRNEIIRQAFWRIGVVPYGEDPDGDQQNIAVFELNAITKFLGANNIPLWLFQEISFNLADGEDFYPLSANEAYYLESAWLAENNSKIPLNILSVKDYFNLPDRLTTKGTPHSVCFDKGLAVPKIYVYPVPDKTYSFVCRIAKRLEDWALASTNQYPDFILPQYWIEPLTWKLAANLAYVFRLKLEERSLLEAKAENLLREVLIDNFKQNDKGDIVFYAY